MARTTTKHPELLKIRDRDWLWITDRTLRRSLAPHLRPDEEVHELLVGAYAGTRGFLAVTDDRVLLAQEPRAGQASASVDLRDVTAVQWVRRGPSGDVVVRTATGSHQLHHVELRHGPAVVAAVQAACGAAAA